MAQAGEDARKLAEALLRAAIDRGDVVPGQRLIEVELAERFDVTRSSLRQAVSTLVSEGLVERIANRGARIRRLTVEEAVELTECRAVLEAFLARKAAERAQHQDVITLRERVRAMRNSLAEDDLFEYMRLIVGLYTRIRAIAHHEYATALVGKLQAQLVRHQFHLSLMPGRPVVSLRELSEIVEAIARGEPDTAEELTRLHLEGTAIAIRNASHPLTMSPSDSRTRTL